MLDSQLVVVDFQPWHRLVFSEIVFPSLAGKLSWDITNTQVSSALHPSGVAKPSSSFGWGKSWKVTAAGWPVTLCDPIWHVISHSSDIELYHYSQHSCAYSEVLVTVLVTYINGWWQEGHLFIQNLIDNENDNWLIQVDWIMAVKQCVCREDDTTGKWCLSVWPTWRVALFMYIMCKSARIWTVCFLSHLNQDLLNIIKVSKSCDFQVHLQWTDVS